MLFIILVVLLDLSLPLPHCQRLILHCLGRHYNCFTELGVATPFVFKCDIILIPILFITTVFAIMAAGAMGLTGMDEYGCV